MRLKVEPDVVALAPGDVTDLLVRVHNDGEDACTPLLQVRGVDPDDVMLPTEIVAVPAGSVMTAVVRVRAAVDAIPGDQRIAVAAEDLEGGQGTVSATTVLRIGARPDVAVEVDPVATVGRRGAKALTVLRNRSDRRLQVDLEGRGEGVRVSFRPARVTLDPGETRRVRTRMRRAQRSWFGEIRHGAVITARGIGAPASTTATFTQKPSVPRPAVRGLAALLALAVWVAATVVVFDRLTAQPEAGTDAAGVVTPAPPGPGRTSATGMFVEEDDGGVRLPVVIRGSIDGPRELAGTTVTAERIAFGDPGTTTGLTKVVALTEVKLPRGNVLDVVRTTTDERGRFRIASGLVEDAFYRVTAVRAGFEVGSFVVSTSADAPEVELSFALLPASGSLAGLVTDTSGVPLGGANVLVTDGAAEYSTVTPADGEDAGRWVLEGLATPATYQVVVTRRGFAAQTLIVELDGGQQRTGVDATMPADLGTIVGRVTDAGRDPGADGVLQGVGALTVTLSGPEARETRTLTVAGDLRGTFDLPGLPFGDYLVTFSGDGWVTRQAEVAVDDGLVRLDTTIARSSGVVQGWVWQDATTAAAFQGACRYPRANQRDGAVRIDEETGEATDELLAALQPCGGVAVTVTSADGDVFATASATATGFFQVAGVPAGEYVLTLSRPGYVSHVRSVVVRPGRTLDLNPLRPSGLDDGDAQVGRDFVPLELSPPPTVCAGTLVLSLIDFRDGRGVAPVTDASGPGIVRFEGATATRIADCEEPPSVSRLGTSGTYRIDGLPLGELEIIVGDDDEEDAELLGWAYFEGRVTVEIPGLDPVAASLDVSPRPRDLTIPEGLLRLIGPEEATRQVTLEVLRADGELAGAEDEFTPIAISGGGTNAARTFQLLAPDRDLRLRVVGGVDPATGSYAGYESVGVAGGEEIVFELPAGVGPYVLPLRSVATAELTEGVAVLTTGEDHRLAPGDEVVVAGVGAPFDGTHVLAAASGTLLAFPLDEPDVASLAPSGLATVRRTSEAPAIELTARTRVTGTVLGVASSTNAVVPLGGATVTFPGEVPVVTPSSGAGVGTFSLVVDAGTYGASGGLGAVEVSAAGHVTRSFLPAPGRALLGAEEVLRPAGADAFLLYPGLAASTPTAGDVGLDSSPRTVRISTELLGASASEVSERTFRFELRDGTVAGQPVRLAGGALAPVVASPELTLRAGEGASTFELAGVPVGTYTRVAVPVDAAADRIALRGVTMGSGGTLSGAAPTFTLVVPPGDGAVELSATVRARTLLQGVVRGFDLSPMSVSPLEGATVTVTGSGSGATRVVGGSVATLADGSFSLEVDAADYPPGSVTVAAAGYETGSLGGPVAAATSGLPGTSGLFLLYGDVATPGADELLLNPAPRTVTVDVRLTAVGAGAVERPVTVELVGGEFAPGVPARLPNGTPVEDLEATAGAGAAGGVVSTAGTGRFTFSGVPVGTYTLRISGDHVRTVEQTVVVAPSAEPLGVGTVDVQARSELTVTVTALQDRTGDLVSLPLVGATMTLAPELAASDGRDTVTAPAATATGADGTFTVWIDAGTHAADAVQVSATGYTSQQVGGDLRAPVLERDVALPAVPRDVTGTLTLSGPTGVAPAVTRAVVVELWAGTVTDFSTGVPVDSVTIPSASVGGNTFTFDDVAPIAGGYTLRAVGGAPDTFQVTEDTAALIVLPSSEPLVLDGTTLSVTARTRLTLTTTGVQRVMGDEALTGPDEPLAGVDVAVPAGGSAALVPPAAVSRTGADGTLVVDLDAGDYADGAETLGAIGLTLGGYEGASLSDALTAATEARTVVLDPSDTTFAVDLGLLGAAGATRTVTLTVGADPAVTEGGLSLAVAGPLALTSTTELPVGVYTFEVSGTGVATTTVTRVIGPATAAFPVTRIDVQATVTVSGTLVEDATTGSDGTRKPDEVLPVAGATVTGPGGVSHTDAEGAFTLVLDSGTSPTLTIDATGFVKATPVVAVGASPTQSVGPFTLDRATGIRIEGKISASVTAVSATDGTTVVTAASLAGSRYSLTGLDTGPVWRIDFATSSPGVVVSRYVQSAEAIAIVLDQDAEIDDVGEITVTLEVGQDPAGTAGQSRSVRVTLTESVPSGFFTIPGGEVVETVTVTAPSGGGATLDDLMTGEVTFSGLAVVGSSPSIPVDRFSLEVEVLEVGPGPDPDAAYRWTLDPEADTPGRATVSGFELPRTVGSAAAVTRPFRFVRAPSEVQELAAVVKSADNDVASGSVVLTWDAPAGRGGADALRYDVSYVVTGAPGSPTTPSACSDLSALTCTVDGLEDGTTSTFTVTASNVSISALSASTTIEATPRDVPGAPTSVLASATGSGGAQIEWTAPVDDGGSPIIDFTVTSTPGALTCTADAPSTSCTIASGFDPGRGYTFTVTARNAAGSSIPSAASDEIIPDPTFDFTTQGATGVDGPTSVSYPFAASVDESAPGRQLWTVPLSGLYDVTVRGAQGGSSGTRAGGDGAVITARIALSAGEQLAVLVGQTGGAPVNQCNAGGGGGSFVWTTVGPELLVAAGGGGGASGDGSTSSDGAPGAAASLTQTPTSSPNANETAATSNVAAGWAADAEISPGDQARPPGPAFRPTAATTPGRGGPGAASTNGGDGGFGGGLGGSGGPCGSHGAGGGGGFVGGDSQRGLVAAGGGGSSFVLATAVESSAAATNEGPGSVRFAYVGPAPIS